MADAILLLGTHLGKTNARLRRSKDGVVAKAVGAHALLQNLPFHNALEEMFFTTLYEHDSRAETGLPRRGILQFVKQATDVGIGVVAVAVSVHLAKAGGVDSRLTAQGIYLQTCVVGKTVHTIVLRHILGFLPGISFQRLGRLGDVLVASDILEPAHLVATSQYLPYLTQFVLVVGGHDESFHIPFLFIVPIVVIVAIVVIPFLSYRSLRRRHLPRCSSSQRPGGR